MYDIDDHLEAAYEDRYQVDDDRDYAEEAENAAIDRDDDGPDFPDVLTGDDMEQYDDGDLSWLFAPGL